MSYNMIYEHLLLLHREGNEEAYPLLSQIVRSKRFFFINTALVDLNYNFSKFDQDYIFELCFAKASREYTFQLGCSFLHYLVSLMAYAFANLAKTKSEYAASINLAASQEPVALLRDCSQKDDNDLMGTLFTWRGDIIALARKSNKFNERDVRIIDERLNSVPFAEIAEEQKCSLSTCKKVWKKFLDYAKDILGITNNG